MDLVLRDGSSLQRVLGDAKKLSKLRKMPLVSGGDSTPSRASAPAPAAAAAAEKPAPPPPPPDIEMGELAAPRAVPPSPSLDLLSTLSNMVLVSKRNVESARHEPAEPERVSEEVDAARPTPAASAST